MQASSIVINVTPRLPWHPIFNGKLTNCSSPLSRSPIQPQHVNVCKVSISVPWSSTDVYRLQFGTATSTDGSIDPAGTSRRVSRWLCGLGESVVSCFAILCLADLCRCDLDSSTSVPGSNDPIGTVRVVSAWLRDSHCHAPNTFGTVNMECTVDSRLSWSEQ